MIFGIADGVSSHPRNHLASHYLMALLSQCKSLDSQWLRQAHGDFCVKYRLQICIKMVKMHRLYDDFSAVICEIV
ncbi:hypothetical protein [Bibersteinia trehalosi]|uniref:hypothetical protein n=1 Tax=Bibersteinia trehalosi TaxID=47735 RepID=UPI0021AB4092|nr:hypothetical protein [Bibersteinia trehalosi]